MPSLVRIVGALCLLLSGTVIVTGLAEPPAAVAGSGQAGAAQVTLNPGGGVLSDGSDGIRFTVNADLDYGSGVTTLGQDAVHYRNNTQYCCSAGAPMLNVGGTLFGQAGPASWSGLDWSSITVLSTSGATATGPRTSTTGDSSARLRYVATKDGLEYVMERTVSYTYPNEFVTDSYVFTIPAGNTEQVKFYLGGDTAPGGSDSGYGVMLGEPVRTVISLNTSSRVQFGFAELGDSKPFDGATSQHYNAPYAAVQTGADIGFVGTAANHDAGLMMQWNLGSEPGSQRAALRQFASPQGTQLVAGFDRAYAGPDEPVDLNISIQNTELSPVSGLGYTMTLPAGTTRVPGTAQNTCGGTLNLTASAVGLSGGTVAAANSCLVTVQVRASDPGSYTVSAANASGLTGLTNNVGNTSFLVLSPPEITSTAIPALTVGEAATATLAADSDQPPTWSVSSGELPAGMTLDAVTGVLDGTPEVAGPYDFTVTATTAGGTDTQNFTGTVAKGTPGLGGTVSSASVPYGTGPTLEATGLPAAATGTVTFTSGAVTLCTATLPTTSCAAADDLAPDDYPVSAAYSGDDNWNARTETIGSFEVVPAVATVSGSLSTASTTFGTPVTVTTEVLPSSATGEVAVTGGGETLCALTLPDTECEIGEGLDPGTYPIALSYSGETRYLSASGSAGTLTVDRAVPAPTVDDPVPAVFGDEVELTLPGLPASATGTVTFTVDGNVLCSYTLGDATSCTTAHGLGAGEYDLEIDYSGDSRFEPVARTTTLAVDKASTMISTPARLGSTVGETAAVTVSGLPGGATGRVLVSLAGQELCSFDITTATSCEVGGLDVGTHVLTVAYSGDGDYLEALATVTLEVTPVADVNASEDGDEEVLAAPSGKAIPATGAPVGLIGAGLLAGALLLLGAWSLRRTRSEPGA